MFQVDALLFSNFINKFETEDQRAEAKIKIAQITAQQKKFEARKRALEEELRKRKEEEEEEERVLQAQLEEQILEQQMMEEKEDRLRAEYELKKVQTELENQSKEEKKVKKVKKKKKKDESKPEELPQLKMGFLDFSDNKSKFEQLRNKEALSPEVKQVKVNKLTVNPFIQSNFEDKKEIRSAPVKINKLQKNKFIKQLEKTETPALREGPKNKISDTQKKVQPEIKFESKKISASKKEEIVAETTVLMPKVRGSKSIENPIPGKKEKKHSSTLSLLFDNTKQFFRNSKEKLMRLSKEALNELEEMHSPVKPTTSEMQNYLLSHVLFDKAEVQSKPLKEISLTKEEEFDLYLDKEYKDKIEQYCSLVEESKPRKPKKVSKKELPQIKLVEVKSIQEQLRNQLERTSEKRGINEELENLGNRRVKEMKELLTMEPEKNKSEERQRVKPKKINNSILNKIKSLEQAEEERIKREKENEERIQKLVEKEMLREEKRREKELQAKGENDEQDEDEDEDDDEDEELKRDIRIRLEEELDNLEEEQRELETTEKMLIDEEKAWEGDAQIEKEEIEDNLEIKEIKEDIIERRKNADHRKKVLQQFQHIFDHNENGQKMNDEFSLRTQEKASKKKFEDNVLFGVSDIITKVKNKFEATPEENNDLYKTEVKRKLNDAALRFETMKADSPENIPRQKSDKQWTWKSKTPLELELENMPKKEQPDLSKKPHGKKGYQELKYDELLEDINAVKQRLKERNINLENEEKMEEMNRFMEEIKQSLREIENEDTEDLEIIKPTNKRIKKKSEPKKNTDVKKSERSALIQNLKKELFIENQRKTNSSTGTDLEDFNISVNSLKKKITENDSASDARVSLDKVPLKSNSGVVSKIAEMLVVPDDSIKNTDLRKAPKLLLRNTTLENEDDSPLKTLEELKTEQQNKKWAWKEKEMSDLQDYIKSFDNIVPKKIIDQQKNLQDLEEELNVVESLINNKDTDIIVQIREEKEREFNNFMHGVKCYLSEETKTSEEDNFKKGMQSYLDLIDEKKTEHKMYTSPPLKTNTLNKLKSKLFQEDSKSTESTPPSPLVRKLPMSVINAMATPKPSELVKPTLSPEISSTSTKIAKNLFETQKEIPSPVIKSKGLHPSVLNLKRSNSNTLRKNIQNQLKYKLKTILEVHEYIESHENLCVPTVIETIQKFILAKKTEDKLSCHQKFLETSRFFVEQKARSEEQKIFKDNIEAYLKIIENPDNLSNGTPKLKKHASLEVQPNTNIKKKEIQICSNSERELEKYKMLNPEEKRKSILQKYGFKDRIQVTEISDDSDDSADENIEENVKDLSDNELCLKYGLPPIYIPEENKQESSSNSIIGFKNLLSKIRQVSVGKQGEHVYSPTIQRKDERPDSKPVPGSASKIKNIFETQETHKSESSSMTPHRQVDLEIFNSGINSRIKKQFEQLTPSPELVRKFPTMSLQKSSTVSNIGSMFENFKEDENSVNNSPSLNENRLLSIEKSRSFSKFKNAFEAGVGLNDDEEPDISENYAKAGVKAELNALKSSSKIQRMFRINRSNSDVEHSPRKERELDEKTLHEISKSRSEITNMFESKIPKITFGGSKPKKASEPVKPKVKKEESSENRKWVFDTIQKYFDVIVEEEQEEEEEDEEEDPDNNVEDDDESDYTSAEEELHEPTVSGRISVLKEIDVSAFFQNNKHADKVITPIISKRKISIDDFVDDAAKQFDEMTDGSNTSLDALNKKPAKGVSWQNLNQLSKSNSSTKIRGLLTSVVHGSANNLNLNTFKSNLLAHLNSKNSSLKVNTKNYDPGVADDSDSEYSEYDD